MKTIIYITALIIAVCVVSVHADSWEWAEVEPMHFQRTEHMVAEIGGRIYVFGGRTPDRRGRGGMQVSDAVEVYNTNIDRWIQLKPMPVPLCRAAIAVVGVKIYIFGGSTTVNHVPTDNMLVFNTRDSSFTLIEQALPQPRESLRAVAVGNRILLLGGNGQREDDIYATGWWYNTDDDEWQPALELPRPLLKFGIVIQDQGIWVVGGFNPLPVEQVFRLVDRQWTRGPALPLPIGDLTSTVIEDSLLIVIGGISRERNNQGQNVSASTFLLNSNDDMDWTEITQMNSPRAGHSTVKVQGAIYAIGGIDQRMMEHEHTLSSVEKLVHIPDAVDDLPDYKVPTLLPIVSPNPANHNLSINSLPRSAKVEIVDINGRILFRSAGGNTPSLNVNLTDFPTGTLFYRVSSPYLNYPHVGKFVIMR